MVSKSEGGDPNPKSEIRKKAETRNPKKEAWNVRENLDTNQSKFHQEVLTADCADFTDKRAQSVLR